MRPIKLLLPLIVLLLALSALAQQQPFSPEALSAELKQAVTTQHLPGISVAIYRPGTAIATFTEGYTDIQTKTPVTTHTLYRLASISKTITAVATLQLASHNKLDIDKSAQQYCPAFNHHPEVTARELLSHRSGVHHYENDSTQFNTIHFSNLNDAVKTFAADPLKFPAGTGFQYTSYGFTVLGCEIEGASAQSYEAYVRSHILTPAKMDETFVDDSRVPASAKATFYSLSGVQLVPAVPLDISDRLPGGGWLSTPTDMVKFADIVLSHGLLSRKWTDRMWTETSRPGDPMRYALGWSVGFVGSHPIFAHGGGQAGTSTSLLLVPDQHLAIAVFTNRDGADMTGLSQKIAAELLHVPISPAP